MGTWIFTAPARTPGRAPAQSFRIRTVDAPGRSGGGGRRRGVRVRRERLTHGPRDGLLSLGLDAVTRCQNGRHTPLEGLFFVVRPASDFATAAAAGLPRIEPPPRRPFHSGTLHDPLHTHDPAATTSPHGHTPSHGVRASPEGRPSWSTLTFTATVSDATASLFTGHSVFPRRPSTSCRRGRCDFRPNSPRRGGGAAPRNLGMSRIRCARAPRRTRATTSEPTRGASTRVEARDARTGIL